MNLFQKILDEIMPVEGEEKKEEIVAENVSPPINVSNPPVVSSLGKKEEPYFFPQPTPQNLSDPEMEETFRGYLGSFGFYKIYQEYKQLEQELSLTIKDKKIRTDALFVFLKTKGNDKNTIIDSLNNIIKALDEQKEKFNQSANQEDNGKVAQLEQELIKLDQSENTIKTEIEKWQSSLLRVHREKEEKINFIKQEKDKIQSVVERFNITYVNLRKTFLEEKDLIQ